MNNVQPIRQAQGSPQVVRVRIAPSPTGIPHIGNTRTALFNFLFARHNNGKFILRIEDTDRARIVKGAKEAIIEILDWLGLTPDETYIQSERLDFYKNASQILLSKNLARQDEGAIRFTVPKGKILEWEDAVGKKKISFKSEDVEDFIILKSDGFPTYHLANVVDDCEMKITHVIRGDEWISSTPKHLLLYQAFGWSPPVFAHLPLILGPDKTKLSKRHGAKSVLDYRDEGYLKETLLNFMVLLGWNPGGDQEILTFAEMIKLFSLKDVNTASPIFDIEKLKWMNGVYIRQAKLDELSSKLKIPRLWRDRQSSKLLDKLLPLAQTRMTTLNDFEKLAGPFLEEPEIKLDQKEKLIARDLLEYFLTLEQWNKETILGIFKKVLVEHKIKMPIIYKILTGQESGLPLPEALEIFGKEKTIKRLEKLK